MVNPLEFGPDLVQTKAEQNRIMVYQFEAAAIDRQPAQDLLGNLLALTGKFIDLRTVRPNDTRRLGGQHIFLSSMLEFPCDRVEIAASFAVAGVEDETRCNVIEIDCIRTLAIFVNLEQCQL